MKVRYRILTSTIDIDAVSGVYAEKERDAWPDVAGFILSNKLNWLLSGRRQSGAEPPRKVLASDGEAELDEVKKMLLEGRMSSTDLVDLGQGWQSVIDCHPLEEEALVAARRERRRSAKKSALRIAAALLGFVLFLLYLFVFSRIE